LGKTLHLPELLQLAERIAVRQAGGSLVLIGKAIEDTDKLGLKTSRAGTLGAACDLAGAGSVVLCGQLPNGDLARSVGELQSVLAEATACIVALPLSEDRVPEFRSHLPEAGLELVWGGLVEDNAENLSRDTWAGVVIRSDSATAKDLRSLLATGPQSLRFDSELSVSTLDPAPRTAIVTEEFFGPSRCGGLGTGFTSLAEALAKAGQEVTVVFIGERETPESMDHWVEYWDKNGVSFVPLDVAHPEDASWEFAHLRRSNLAYLGLLELEKETGSFDTIHFPEVNGFGYFSILAKRTGQAFSRTTLCVQTFGSSRWQRTGNGFYMDRVFNFVQDLSEPYSVAHADVVVSASAYLLRWMLQNGYTLPPRTYVEQYVQPHAARGACEIPADPNPAVTGLKELVFFGRLEPRKGLLTTLDAIDLLHDEGCMKGVTITFLGKPSQVEGTDLVADQYIAERATAWGDRVRWQILPDKTQVEAVDYLRGEGRLCLIPSLIDNSPNTVMEALGLGIPFLTARTGGIGELIHPDDVASSTFFHPIISERHLPFSERIRSALTDGLAPARRAINPEQVERHWISWHAANAQSARLEQKPSKAAPRPMISCCVYGGGDPSQLAEVLAGLEKQKDSDLEVLLVLPKGYEPPKNLADNCRTIEQSTVNPALAWNSAAAEAKGDFLLLLDGTEVPQDGAIDTLVDAAQTSGCPLVTGFCPGKVEAVSDLVTFPLADPGVVPLVIGLPKSPLLIERSVFLAIGGADPSAGSCRPGWELVVRAHQHGSDGSHTVVPAPIFRRLSETSTAQFLSAEFVETQRLLSAYRPALPGDFAFLPGYLDSIQRKLLAQQQKNLDLQYKVTDGYDLMRGQKIDAYAQVKEISAEMATRIDEQENRFVTERQLLQGTIETAYKEVEKQADLAKEGWDKFEESLKEKEQILAENRNLLVIEEGLQEQIELRQNTIGQLEGEIATLEEAVSYRDQRIKNMEGEIERIWKETTATNDRRKAEIAKLKQRVKDSEAELKDLKTEVRELGRGMEKSISHKMRRAFGKT